MKIDNQQTINWSSSDDLIRIIKKIEEPLESIIKASDNYLLLKQDNLLKETSKDIIFSSSQEIKQLIDEVIKKTKGSFDEVPLIFDIYNTNKSVQSMCKEEINPKKISKQDTSWLLKMEDEVYKNIKYKDLNLYDLSFNMAVSERQLHRKIKNLLYLTPNKYIRVLKLHKAKELIDDYLYDTISQISYAVGYYDTHYFSKLFNQQYGIFPKELLKNRG